MFENTPHFIRMRNEWHDYLINSGCTKSELDSPLISRFLRHNYPDHDQNKSMHPGYHRYFKFISLINDISGWYQNFWHDYIAILNKSENFPDANRNRNFYDDNIKTIYLNVELIKDEFNNLDDIKIRMLKYLACSTWSNIIILRSDHDFEIDWTDQEYSYAAYGKLKISTGVLDSESYGNEESIIVNNINELSIDNLIIISQKLSRPIYKINSNNQYINYGIVEGNIANI